MTNDPVLAAAAQSPALSVRLGDLELSPWHPQLQINRTTGIATTNATVKLDVEAAESPLLDYAEPLTITAAWDGVEYPQFAGYVEYGGMIDRRFTIFCRSNAVFEDFSAGVWLHEGVRVFEIIYTTSRMMGFADDMLRIDGMESLGMEQIEVIVPLFGLGVEQELTVGPYRVVPSSSVDWVNTTWTTDPPARRGDPVQVPADFLQGGAYLVGRYPERKLYEAEVAALRDAEVVCAWFGARLSYSNSRLPSGLVQPFNRGSNGIRPQRASLVAVRGLSSGRRWIRYTDPIPRSKRTLVPICDDPAHEPQLPEVLSDRDREALLTFWRARDATDPLGSLISLWDTIEFYANGAQAPKIVSKQELARLQEEAPEWLNENQRQRYIDVLKMINSPSLAFRLDEALRRDGVPISDEERELLQRLRRLRNPAQHGNARVSPSAQDLKKAWAVVARMLLYRLGEREEDTEIP